eukprot:XP_001704767.1 Hypothetical protein GL50803_8728 [Giardia lamblia ATCC 50803]
MVPHSESLLSNYNLDEPFLASVEGYNCIKIYRII